MTPADYYNDFAQEESQKILKIVWKMNFRMNINNFAYPSKSLSQRAVISGFWAFLLRTVKQLFSLLRLVILARILAPQDFGLMGVALLSMATLETFSQTGVQQALIQKKCEIKSYLDSVWTVLILRSFILFTILYLIAPFAATFFDAPDAKPIIQVIGLSVIFQAFTNIGVIYFQKELEFNKQFVYQLSGTLTDFFVAVIAALILKNVWAIVFGLLAGNAAMLITSYLIHPYRPHLSFDIGKARELFGYGKWILGSSILVFLTTQGDDIFAGKLLGTTALGLYQMAYLISNLPATEITHVISQVMFPAYSKIQDDIPKLRETYLKVLQLTAFISFPITSLIFALAPDFTMIFLGKKWMPMVPTIQILVFAGLVRSIAATSGPIFYAVGKPRIETKWQMVRLFVMAVLIYPFTIKWKILGTSMVIFLSIFISTIGFYSEAARIIKMNIKYVTKCMIVPSVNGIIMTFLIIILKSYSNIIGILHLILLLIISLSIYLIMTYLFDEFLDNRMKSIVRESLNCFKKS